MKNAIINFKTDAVLKRQAQKKVDELGISLSSALNALLRKLVRVKNIEFIEEELEPSANLKQVLTSNKRDKKRRYVSPAFDDPEEALRWLHDPKARYANGKKKD